MHSIRHALPLLIALSVPTAWAADNTMDHNKQPPEQSNAQSAGAPSSGGTDKMADKMASKQEAMLKMHKLLHDIDAETDPTKRAALMKQHQQMMQQGMMKMRGGKNCGHMEHEPTT